MTAERFDLAIVGAGAAGMFCAGVAAQRGRRVVLIDHARRPGEKIRISGGGRCNFTNVDAGRVERYASEQPLFARHALRGYGPQSFIELLRRHRIGFHEKHRGQLFCDGSSEQVVAMLRSECDAGGVHWRAPCALESVALLERGGERVFRLRTDAGETSAGALVIATGGLSIPKIGATDLGYRIARQFGVGVIAPRPALVPLSFTPQAWAPFAGLSGLALPVRIRIADDPAAPAFLEDLLFTHRGLSGPAALQISTYWREGGEIEVDLAPGEGVEQALTVARDGGRRQIGSVLGEQLPRRLASTWLAQFAGTGLGAETRVAEAGKRALAGLVQALHHWRLKPSGSEGYRKAEVTAGGVDTRALDPRTMQVRAIPGLHFIGEVVDLTGWLGGYNFQWAWASAYAAAMALSE
ncbi:MAG: aminoacetone oxidase family FAD-binding enzyme [Burkholderiaceae bacterium]|nr:aminoacetone oxidase family FAD-binding enzyme [Burkholderiaceae bacterium]